MPPEEDLPRELKAIEAELAALVPRSERLDVGRVMYLAGRASAERRSRAWPAAFGGMTAVAVTLAVMLALRPVPEVVERIVQVPAGPEQTASPGSVVAGSVQNPPEWSIGSPALAALLSDQKDLSATEILRLPYPRFRNYVLTHGLDAWPEPPSEASDRSGGPRTYGDWQKVLLERRS